MFGQDLLKLSTLLILYIAHRNIGPRKKPTYANETLLSHRPKVFAHRGGALEGFENSLSAIKKAHKIGVDGIEIDVRKTANGVYVAIHDETLTRITGQSDSVHAIEYDNIDPYLDVIHNDYGGVFECNNVDGEKPPTLEDIFAFVAETDLFVSIDMMLDDPADSINVLLMAKEFHILHKIIFNTSADHQTLRDSVGRDVNFINSSSHLPDVYQDFITGDFAEHPHYEFDIFNTVYDFKTIKESPYYDQVVIPGSPANPSFTLGDVLSLLQRHEKEVGLVNRVMKMKRVPVMYYLANYDEDYKKALYLGANGIMTDRPADLISFLNMMGNLKREHEDHWGHPRESYESNEEEDHFSVRIGDKVKKEVEDIEDANRK